MAIVRIYTGSDDKSHMEVLDLASHTELTSLHDVQGIQFRASEVGSFMDFHNAPRRQYVITLSGGMEIGLADGTVRSFGPGDVLLAEDLTGQGHTTRMLGDQPRLSATIPLPEA